MYGWNVGSVTRQGGATIVPVAFVPIVNDGQGVAGNTRPLEVIGDTLIYGSDLGSHAVDVTDPTAPVLVPPTAGPIHTQQLGFDGERLQVSAYNNGPPSFLWYTVLTTFDAAQLPDLVQVGDSAEYLPSPGQPSVQSMTPILGGDYLFGVLDGSTSEYDTGFAIYDVRTNSPTLVFSAMGGSVLASDSAGPWASAAHRDEPYVYWSAWTNGAEVNNPFVVVDCTNPAAPVIHDRRSVSSLSILDYMPMALHIHTGNPDILYMFLRNGDVTIYDIADRLNPALLRHQTLPTVGATIGRVEQVGNFLFLGAGLSISIADVSDPINPVPFAQRTLAGGVSEGGVGGVRYIGDRYFAVGHYKSVAGTVKLGVGVYRWDPYVGWSVGSVNVLEGATGLPPHFIAVGDTNVITSPDGAAWSGVTPIGTSTAYAALGDIAYGGTTRQYVAVGYFQGYPFVMISPTGLAGTWTRSPETGLTGGAFSITWAAPQQLWVLGTNGRIFTSPDALTWTQRVYVAPESYSVVAAANGMIIAPSGKFSWKYSTDGINWYTCTVDVDVITAYNGLAFNGTRWVAAGGGGYVLTSENGINWVTSTNLETGQVNGAAASPDIVVLVGNQGAIWTSPNGLAPWTRRVNPLGSSYTMLSAHYSEAKKIFVAGGESGVIYSTNGVDWSVATGPTQGLAVGISG